MNTESTSSIINTFDDIETLNPPSDQLQDLNFDEIELEFVSFLNQRFSKDDLKEHNIKFTLKDGKILLNYENYHAWILYDKIPQSDYNYLEIKKNWLSEFYNFKKSSYVYIVDYDYIHNNTSLEIPIKSLSLNKSQYSQSTNLNYKFDNHEYEISINSLSMIFYLAFFNSSEFSHYWNDIFQESKFKGFIKNPKKNDKKIALNVFFRGTINSIKFVLKKTEYTKELHEKYIDIVDSCLYTLVLEKNDVLSIKNKKFSEQSNDYKNLDSKKANSSNKFTITKLKYDPSLVSFYKAASNSSLPSQKFLDFYHIFEFLFLRVSEDVIYDKVKSYVNHSRFRSSPNEIDRLISMIKKHNTENDETEMLKKVINKYVHEDDLIDYINDNELEKSIKGKRIFGGTFNISNKNGHAVGNICIILKHIRNALVHSSDRYKREDCHIPFSESEKLVSLFLPIMDYLAQKVIAGTAETID